MKATNVGLYSSFIQAIGLLLLLSSVLGSLFAMALPVFGSLISGRIVLVGSGLIVGVVSVVGSITGWLVLGSKNVLKCARCGFIFERA